MYQYYSKEYLIHKHNAFQLWVSMTRSQKYVTYFSIYYTHINLPNIGATDSRGILISVSLNMHVEGNRGAFLHVHNFKIFVDEPYWVRMYEHQT